MHKFLRAVGFSGINSREKLQSLIALTIKNATERSFTTMEEDVLLAEYSLNYGNGIGITVCGEMDKEDKFIFDYCFPYYRSAHISSSAEAVIERHASRISYAGVVEDNRIGVTIIFYLLNRIPYVMRKNTSSFPAPSTTITLTGLSVEGTIVMPIVKNPEGTQKDKHRIKKRNMLLEAAKNGDESAIETLTLNDMDMYTQISKKIKNNDIYTLVDTCFMPYGVECDQYSVLGEIVDWKLTVNSVTGEEIYQMLLNCNEITLSVCINKRDLLGEPDKGRRFKGVVWLQGFLNFPD